MLLQWEKVCIKTERKWAGFTVTRNIVEKEDFLREFFYVTTRSLMNHYHLNVLDIA